MANTFHWNYTGVVNETVANIASTQLIINHLIVIVIGHQVGEYGSVNIGSNGGNYKRIKFQFQRLRESTHYFQNAALPYIDLRRHKHTIYYLCEQICNLKDYSSHLAGPGGQGQNKINLNIAISRCRERAFTLNGVIHYHQMQLQPDLANFLQALSL